MKKRIFVMNVKNVKLVRNWTKEFYFSISLEFLMDSFLALVHFLSPKHPRKKFVSKLLGNDKK